MIPTRKLRLEDVVEANITVAKLEKYFEAVHALQDVVAEISDGKQVVVIEVRTKEEK
jgi:hypothetical protein|tara:strand:+ start:217 stop:387 length:171 start_codon:yes stop_codon:yes gene_type:complete